MFRYRNLPLAFFYEALIGLFTTILIYYFGQKGLAFIAMLALRPIVFKKNAIEPKEIWFYPYYKIVIYSVYSACAIIILFYIIDELFLPENFLIINRYKIVLMIIPTWIFTHGIAGYFYFKKYPHGL